MKNLHDPEHLTKLLNEALKRVPTPQELWDQRVSFVYGQLAFSNPNITKEEVAKRAEALYGPRPKE